MRKLIIVLACTALASSLYAQRANRRAFTFTEVYGGLGSIHLAIEGNTDGQVVPRFFPGVSRFSAIESVKTGASGSLGFRHFLNQGFAFAAELTPASVSPLFIADLHGRFEFYLLKPYRGLAPYLFAGGGGMMALDTVQKSEVFTSGVAVTGIGIRFVTNSDWSHVLELGYRSSLTPMNEDRFGVTYWNSSYVMLQYRIALQLQGSQKYTRKGFVKRSRQEITASKQRKKFEQSKREIDPVAEKLSNRERRQIQRYLKRKRKQP